MKIQPFSSIQKVNKTVQIALPAAFASNEIFGVQEVLESWKCQYVQQLQGIVVNFKKVTVQPKGFIPVGQPTVHVSVTANFYLFCPKIGDIIKGRINRISREHVGCLVHRTINVTIHLTDDTSSDLMRFLYLDKEILFEITMVFFRRKVIRVNGKVTSKCIELMQEIYPEDQEVSWESAPSKCLINPASSPHSNSHMTNNYASLGDDVLTQDLLRIFKAEKLSDEEMDFSAPPPTASALLSPKEVLSQPELPSTELDSSPESKQMKRSRKIKIKKEKPSDLDISCTETESKTKKRKREKSISSEDLPQKKRKEDSGEDFIKSEEAIINDLISEINAESNLKSHKKKKKKKQKSKSSIDSDDSPKKIKKEKSDFLNVTNSMPENCVRDEKDSKKSEKSRKKHKSKGSKKNVKDKDELKALKKKKKSMAPGAISKKDKIKKKSKKDKSSDKSKKVKNKDKKSKRKKKDKIEIKTEK